MNGNFKRTDRIAQLMQRKLAELIQREVKDPRLSGFVTVSAVKVAADLSHARIYFTVLNEDKAEAVSILNSAAKYLRSALARTIKLRTVPQLHFIYDESIEYGKHLSRLIDEVNEIDDNNSVNDKKDEQD